EEVVQAHGAATRAGGGEVHDERLARRLARLAQAGDDEGGGQPESAARRGQRQRKEGEESEGEENEGLAVQAVGEAGDGDVDQRRGEHLEAGQAAELDGGAAEDVDEEEQDEELRDALGPTRQD